MSTLRLQRRIPGGPFQNGDESSRSHSRRKAASSADLSTLPTSTVSPSAMTWRNAYKRSNSPPPEHPLRDAAYSPGAGHAALDRLLTRERRQLPQEMAGSGADRHDHRRRFAAAHRAGLPIHPSSSSVPPAVAPSGTRRSLTGRLRVAGSRPVLSRGQSLLRGEDARDS